MHTGVARAALIVGVGLLSIAGYNVVSQASQVEGFSADELVSSLGDFPASAGTGAPHELSRLKLLQRTMHFVDEKYVDPASVNPDLMFDSALDAVERRVSEVLFQRSDDGQLLHISVGATPPRWSCHRSTAPARSKTSSPAWRASWTSISANRWILRKLSTL